MIVFMRFCCKTLPALVRALKTVWALLVWNEYSAIWLGYLEGGGIETNLLASGIMGDGYNRYQTRVLLVTEEYEIAFEKITIPRRLFGQKTEMNVFEWLIALEA